MKLKTKIMVEIWDELLSMFKSNDFELGGRVGLSSGTLGNWRSAKNAPEFIRPSTLRTIEERLNIQIEILPGDQWKITRDVAPAFFLRREISAVIADLRSRGLDLDAEIATIGLHTGLRRGEILSLSWEDVDLDRGILRVRSSESYKVKGGRIRVVPINDTAGEILSRRVNSRGVIFSGVLPETLSRRFKKSVRRLHLREDLHFHSLRHTYASWLVQKGVSLYVVQRLLGHSSPTMTQVYAHLAPEDLRTHVRLLEDHHEDPGENSSE